MNTAKVEVCEKAIEKILNRNTRLEVQSDGLPNLKWSKDVGALRVLKELSTKYQKGELR